MPKFRKKPIEVEAFQVGPKLWSDPSAWPEWFFEATQKPHNVVGSAYMSVDNMDGLGTVSIITFTGLQIASVGDWIVYDEEGSLYPCKPDIFEATYESVDDGEGEEIASVPADTAEETDVPNLEELATAAGLVVKAYRNGDGSVTCVIAEPDTFPGPVAVTGDYFEACDFVRNYRGHRS